VNAGWKLSIPGIAAAAAMLSGSSTLARQGAGADLSSAAHAIVAADGSGQFRTVQEAIDAVPQGTTARDRWVIFVKAGIYHELVYVQREKRFVTLVGEDPNRTVMTFDLNANAKGADGRPIGTFRTPTSVIDADDFTAENLTFENAAGPVGQALAIRVDGDRVVFRNCRFLGWQDTVFLNRGRQYFEDSYIQGHIDFIFGGATAYFSRCQIHCLRNGYITAAATPPEVRYGFVFNESVVDGEPGVATYLGRPWRDYAQVAFLHSQLSAVVAGAGWHNWDRPAREKTTRFVESGNSGPGSTTASRVKWVTTLPSAEASNWTAEAVMGGADRWNPRSIPAHASASRATRVSVAPQPPGRR
jgi:pectinesterase